MAGTKKTIEEIAKTSSIFAERLGNKKVEYDGISFELQALPSLLATYISGEATRDDGTINRGIQEIQYLRFGVVDIEDLEIVKEPIRMMGKAYNVIPDYILDMIKPNFLALLFVEILNLTHLTEAEREKLDFTTPSGNGESNAETNADAGEDTTMDAPDAGE